MNPKLKAWFLGLATAALHTGAKFGFLVIGVVVANFTSSVTDGHPLVLLDWKTLLLAYSVGLIYGSFQYMNTNAIPFDSTTSTKEINEKVSTPNP